MLNKYNNISDFTLFATYEDGIIYNMWPACTHK